MAQLKQEVMDSIEVAASVARAIEIGHELVAITKAIDEAQIGWKNAHPNHMGFQFYEEPIFKALSAHRESLRKELNALEFPGVQ